MYTHCQHTFQFKQLIKVHVALYDPFKGYNNVPNRGQPDFLNLMMYILIKMLLSFKITFNIFV